MEMKKQSIQDVPTEYEPTTTLDALSLVLTNTDTTRENYHRLSSTIETCRDFFPQDDYFQTCI